MLFTSPNRSENQEMRQNCGYPLLELHNAVHRKDGSIVVAFSHSFHEVNGMGVVREVGALRELARTLTPCRKSNAFASTPPTCTSGWTRQYFGQGRPTQSYILAYWL